MDDALRQRLVGAVVLVLLAVIFVPAVLDGPDQPARHEVALTLPEPGADGAAGVETHSFDLSATEQPGPGVEAPATGSPAAGAPPTIEAWAVQVGSFAGRDNAERLVARLVDAGFSAFLTQVEEGEGVRFRVRVGPEQDRRRAEVLAERLTAEVDAEPRVVRHP